MLLQAVFLKLLLHKSPATLNLFRPVPDKTGLTSVCESAKVRISCTEP